MQTSRAMARKTSLPAWLRKAGFPLEHWQARAFFTSDPQPGAFCEETAGRADAILESIAKLARGRFDMKVIHHAYEPVQRVRVRICKKTQDLEFRDKRYPFELDDATALSRLVEDINAVLIACGAPDRVVLYKSEALRVRCALVPATSIEQLVGVAEVVAPKQLETLAVPAKRGAARAPAKLPREVNIRTIVARRHMLEVDSESVDDPRDYVKLLKRIARIAGLALDDVSCVIKGGKRELSTRLGRTTHRVSLDDRGVIDPRLLKFVDRVLARAGRSERLVELATEDQVLRIACVTPEQRKKLVAAGFTRGGRRTGYVYADGKRVPKDVARLLGLGN